MVADIGLTQEAIDHGVTTMAGEQQYMQQKVANQQATTQTQIANQQDTFNQQQLQYMQSQQQQQLQATQDQAARQTAYDQGRAQQFQSASDRINQAFGAFTPAYFQQYAQDYIGQAADQLAYQRTQANRGMNFDLSRQGLQDSQERANATGLLDEAQGRALADQTAQAQNASMNLQSQVAQAKQNLIGQVQSAQSIGPPIAGSTLGSVNSALNTQNQQISGIAANAGNTVASLQGVPTVSPLGNIFGGVTGGLGSYLSGVQAQNQLNANKAAAAGSTTLTGH